MPFTKPEQLPGGQNMAAFLDMLGFSEGTSRLGTNNGYDVIVTGIDKKAEFFTDFSRHPFEGGRKSKVINSRGLTSNASGRYQQMLKDWPHYRALLRLPDFGPQSQDRLAVQHIKECRALPDIEAGRLRDAIAKCRNIWASLPGAGYGQYEHGFETLRAQYLLHGGVDIERNAQGN